MGLESNMFDVGNMKYAAKFQKLVDVIVIHIQREYKAGTDIGHCKNNQRLEPSNVCPINLPWC